MESVLAELLQRVRPFDPYVDADSGIPHTNDLIALDMSQDYMIGDETCCYALLLLGEGGDKIFFDAGKPRVRPLKQVIKEALYMNYDPRIILDDVRWDFSYRFYNGAVVLHVQMGTITSMHDLNAGKILVSCPALGASRTAMMDNLTYDSWPNSSNAAGKHRDYETPSLHQGQMVHRNHDNNQLQGTRENPSVSYAAAVATFGSTGAQAKAITGNNRAIDARREVDQDLGALAMKTLSRYWGTNIHTTVVDTSLNGHKFLVAGKHLIKQDHDAKITCGGPTVIHGATFVNIRQYLKNKNVSFYVYDYDDRDQQRSMRPMAEAICATLNSGNQSFGGKHSDIARSYMVAMNQDPNRIYSETDTWYTSHVVFADNAYEFDADEFAKIIRDSHCNTYSGYMMLPYELIPPFCWSVNNYYTITVVDKDGTKMVVFTTPDCQNGYYQPYEGYMKFLRSNVINSRLHRISLVTELHSAGPFTWFDGYVARNINTTVPRMLTLDESQQMVVILDLYSGYAADTRRFNPSNCTKINVPAHEWQEVGNSVSALSDKDLTLEHVAAMYKRSMASFKCMQTYLGQEHALNKRDMSAAVLTLYLWEILRRKATNTILSVMSDTMPLDGVILRWWRKWHDIRHGLPLIKELLHLIVPYVNEGMLVATRPLTLLQAGVPCFVSTSSCIWKNIPVAVSNCPFCRTWDLGRQIAVCEHKDPSIKFEYTAEMISYLQTGYSYTKSYDTTGLGVVATKALDAIPTVPATHVVDQFYNIQGAFGTGKSWFARMVIDTDTKLQGVNKCGMVVPVHKLLEPYGAHKDGNTRYRVATIDVAIDKLRGCDTLIFDEIQLCQAEKVYALIMLNKPRRVFVMGDIHQPWIEQKLGTNIWRDGLLRAADVSTHTFCINFRNMPAHVASIKAAHPNKYPYLVADPLKPRVRTGFTIIRGMSKHLYRTKQVLEMHHVRAVADQFGCTTTQEAVGSECDYAVIHFDAPSAAMWNAAEGAHNIVALTRAKFMVYVHLHDSSPVLLAAMLRYGLDVDATDFAGNLDLAYTGCPLAIPNQLSATVMDPRGKGLTVKDVEQIDNIVMRPWPSPVYDTNELRLKEPFGDIKISVAKSPYLKFACENAALHSGHDVLIYVGASPGHRLLNLPFKVIVAIDPKPMRSSTWTVFGENTPKVLSMVRDAFSGDPKRSKGQFRIAWQTLLDYDKVTELVQAVRQMNKTISFVADIRSTSEQGSRNFQFSTPDTIKVFDFAACYAVCSMIPGAVIKFTPIYGKVRDPVRIRNNQLSRLAAASARAGFDPFAAVTSDGFSVSGLRFEYLEGLKYKGVEMRAIVDPTVPMTGYSWHHMYTAALAHYVHRQLYKTKAPLCCTNCDRRELFEHGCDRYYRRPADPTHLLCRLKTAVGCTALGAYCQARSGLEKMSADSVATAEMIGLGLVCACGVVLTTHATHTVTVGTFGATPYVVGGSEITNLLTMVCIAGPDPTVGPAVPPAVAGGPAGILKLRKVLAGSGVGPPKVPAISAVPAPVSPAAVNVGSNPPQVSAPPSAPPVVPMADYMVDLGLDFDLDDPDRFMNGALNNAALQRPRLNPLEAPDIFPSAPPDTTLLCKRTEPPLPSDKITVVHYEPVSQVIQVEADPYDGEDPEPQGLSPDELEAAFGKDVQFNDSPAVPYLAPLKTGFYLSNYDSRLEAWELDPRAHVDQTFDGTAYRLRPVPKVQYELGIDRENLAKIREEVDDFNLRRARLEANYARHVVRAHRAHQVTMAQSILALLAGPPAMMPVLNFDYAEFAVAFKKVVLAQHDVAEWLRTNDARDAPTAPCPPQIAKAPKDCGHDSACRVRNKPAKMSPAPPRTQPTPTVVMPPPEPAPLITAVAEPVETAYIPPRDKRSLPRSKTTRTSLIDIPDFFTKFGSVARFVLDVRNSVILSILSRPPVVPDLGDNIVVAGPSKPYVPMTVALPESTVVNINDFIPYDVDYEDPYGLGPDDDEPELALRPLIDASTSCHSPVCELLGIPDTNRFDLLTHGNTYATYHKQEYYVYGECQVGDMIPCLQAGKPVGHVSLWMVILQDDMHRGDVEFEWMDYVDPPKCRVAGRFQKIYNNTAEKLNRSQFVHAFVAPNSLFKHELLGFWNQPMEYSKPHVDIPYTEAPSEPRSGTQWLALWETLVPTLAQHTTMPFNQANNAVIDMSFRDAKIYVGIRELGINSRGHVQNTVSERLSFSNVYGNVFAKNNPVELLRVSAKRYNSQGLANVAVSAKLMFEIDDMMMWHFAKYHDVAAVCVTEDEIDDLVDGLLRDARDRAYDKRYYGEGWNWREDVLGLRSALKATDKIANMTKGYNPDSVAQGIASSSLGLNAKLQMTARFMALVRRKSIRNDDLVSGITMHGQSLEAFVTKVANQADRFHYIPDTANVDVEKADSGGTPCVTYMQKQYWFKMGFSKHIIDLIYDSVRNVPVSGSGINYTLRHECASGVLITKEYNEINDEVLGNFILDGVGPIAWNGSGDDFNKKQAGLHINVRRLAWVHTWCNSRFVLTSNMVVDFCGMLYNDGAMSLNLLAKVWRVASKHVRDEEHFLEYQLSVREYVQLVEKIGIKQCSHATAQLYSSWVTNMSVEEANSCYDFLKCYAHASFKEIRGFLTMRKVDMPVASSADGVVTNTEMIMTSGDVRYTPL